MLANVNNNLLIVLLLAVPCVFIAVILFYTINSVMKAKKNGEYIEVKMISLTILFMVISGTSWILNMGWIRFIFTFLLVPFVHAIIFFMINLRTAKYITKSRKLKLLSIIFCATYLLSYILLPDGGDVGGLYVFYGLIHSNLIAYICECICAFAIITHIVVFVLQIIEMSKIKRETKGRITLDKN